MNISTEATPTHRSPGKVWLVGAGPGDPDLLTVKALRVIQNAELILFDQLVSDAVRAVFPKMVPAFYVGKSKGKHSLTQIEINQLLIAKASQGLNVVRVKGGDPFVFGRGGEEAIELNQAGIQVEVVAGLTAASACTTAAGIPLTHRGLSQGCTFITAHADGDLNLNWQALATLNHTLVFYMGVSKAGLVRQNLIDNGLNKYTPIAMIENGCRDNQRLVVGTIENIESLIQEENVCSPALIVIGDVVNLSGQLHPQILESINNQHYFNSVESVAQCVA